MFTKPTLTPVISSFDTAPAYSIDVNDLHGVQKNGRGAASTAVTTSKSLRKLLCAAAISRVFCQQLLTKPAQSLEQGYNGESFELDPQERALVLSVKANSLVEFVNQLLEKLEQGPRHQENTAYHDATCRIASSGD